ncbi:hypothetical protein GCM10009565_71480 [Amycolatopsis albidoflavus]
MRGSCAVGGEPGATVGGAFPWLLKPPFIRSERTAATDERRKLREPTGTRLLGNAEYARICLARLAIAHSARLEQIQSAFAWPDSPGQPR